MNKRNQETYDLYTSQLTKESSRFMRMVLMNAKMKLRGNIAAEKVEQWVVDLEKLYRKLLK